MLARGVIEVKPTSDDAWLTADGEQVSRYWNKYRQVLVTNYRDFVFIGQTPQGKPVKLETYRLADSETDFWQATAHRGHRAKARPTPYRDRESSQGFSPNGSASFPSQSSSAAPKHNRTPKRSASVVESPAQITFRRA